MVFLAAAFSLRFFRFGGVQKMVLGGIASGFLLYVLSKITEDMSKAELMPPVTAAWVPVLDRRADGVSGVAVPGGRVMAVRIAAPSRLIGRAMLVAALCCCFAVALPGSRRSRLRCADRFLQVRAACRRRRRQSRARRRPRATSRCSCRRSRFTTTTPTSASVAVGNVQMYYNGSTIEADKVIYNQKTKRLRAEGNIRLTEPDGKITYGDILDLSDDYRDGFVDSLRLEPPTIRASPPRAPTAAKALSR